MSHSNVNQLIHVAWSTIDQQPLLLKSVRNELYAYITKIIRSKNGIVFCCGGSPDHIHLLFKLPPEISLSNLLSHAKAYTSKWLKARSDVDSAFGWQKGYIAFGVQENRLDNVCRYIKGDEERHQTTGQSYEDELRGLLNQQEIPFHEEYLLQNSHSKMCLHLVWSTEERVPILDKEFRESLYDHIRAAAPLNKGQIYSIGGVEDHIHVLMEVPRDIALSDLMKHIKTNSTHWLHGRNSDKFRLFQWQVGYGAFSVSFSCLDDTRRYIEEQEEHHRKYSFSDEWQQLFQRFQRPMILA